MSRARENGSDQVAVNFTSAFDWLCRVPRGYSGPITEQIRAGTTYRLCGEGEGEGEGEDVA